MLIRRLFPLLVLTAIPCVASAQSDDAAYCAALSALASHYLTGGNTLGGRELQDLDTSVAIDQCRSGNTAAGIPVLERKLRSNGFTLPKR